MTSGIKWMGKPIEDLTRDEAIQALRVCIEREISQYATRQHERKMLQKFRDARS